jgi:hypothetical protein
MKRECSPFPADDFPNQVFFGDPRRNLYGSGTFVAGRGSSHSLHPDELAEWARCRHSTVFL